MRTVADDDLDGPSGDGGATGGKGAAAFSARRGPRPADRLGDVVLAAVVVGGVVARFVQRSPLWLDEALSVNIARLPVGDLLEALRHDGHPPLYYLLLHGWMEVVGESDVAVRALSGVFSVAALPLAWIAGRRLAGPAGARWSLAVAALSPFVVRYATEARMYSLVMLLVLAGYLLITDALRRPTWPRLVVIAAVAGLLLLSHYWSFYLLAAVGLLLVGRAWRRPGERSSAVRVIVAVAAGGVLFLPWLGGFLYQSGHTGTPWGSPYRPTAIVQTTLVDMGGSRAAEAGLYGATVVALVLLALFAVRSADHHIELDTRTSPTVRWEVAVALGVLAIGGVVGYATDATFQGRYAATVVPLVLLAVAVGLTGVPGRARLVVAAVYFGLSLFGVGWVNYFQRSQSAEVASAVAAQAEAGDVVVYCPDQLGPAYAREMPEGLVELAYPTLDPPDRVDWVDYADRNGAADPAAVAREVLDRADGHAVFVVWMSDYATFGTQCEQLVGELGAGDLVVRQDESRFFEPATLHVRPADAPAAG
jgi:mannosyltransferase